MASRRKAKPIPAADEIQAIITDRGTIVTKEILKQYELNTEPVSKQKDIEQKWGSGVLQPPKDLTTLLRWKEMDTTHASCINAKRGDVVGLGYQIIEDEDVEDGQQQINIDQDAQYQQLKNFLKKVNPEEDLTSLLEKVYDDFDGCGNGFIEVARDVAGLVNGLYWCSAVYIRVMADKVRYLQCVGNQKTYFKKYGYIHTDETGKPTTKQLNKDTGKWEDGLSPQQIANEIIHIKQHTWQSSVYGLPAWYPAVYAIFGNMKEREYNIDFFLNFGIPAYAIITTGAKLNAETEDEINKFFKTELKGSNHKTLTLATPKNSEIKFEKLNVDIKEASFRMYRGDNRDEILTAHRVPPYRVGIVIQGQLGGNVAEETDKIYLDSVVNSLQKKFAWVVNQLIIKDGLQIQKWITAFIDIDVADATKRSEIHKRYFDMGVLTPNEIRIELGKDPYVGGDAFYIQGSLIPVGISKEGIESGRVKEQDLETGE